VGYLLEFAQHFANTLAEALAPFRELVVRLLDALFDVLAGLFGSVARFLEVLATATEQRHEQRGEE
jgi:hypothetical protein